MMKTVTLRLDDDLHMELRIKTIKEHISMQEYITNLIKKDMEQLSEGQKK